MPAIVPGWPRTASAPARSCRPPLRSPTPAARHAQLESASWMNVAGSFADIHFGYRKPLCRSTTPAMRWRPGHRDRGWDAITGGIFIDFMVPMTAALSAQTWCTRRRLHAGHGKRAEVGRSGRWWHLAHGRVAGEGLQQRHLREHVHQRVPVVHGGGQVRHLQGHPRRVVPQGRRLRPQHLAAPAPPFTSPLTFATTAELCCHSHRLPHLTPSGSSSRVYAPLTPAVVRDPHTSKLIPMTEARAWNQVTTRV